MEKNHNKSETPEYAERSVYPLQKRVARQLMRLLGRWRRKSYDIRIISVDGEPRYKKVVFRDAARAAKAKSDLQGFGPSPHFPGLYKVQDNEVIVDYVFGNVLEHIDNVTIDKLSDFYAAVYKRNPRLELLADTPFVPHFEANLRKLREFGVLDSQYSDALQKSIQDLAPDHVWVGFDYTDPIKNNLVLTGEPTRVCAIDIKNLRSDSMIGRGVAKARRRWLHEAAMPGFMAQLKAKDAPDFSVYFDFIRLYDDIQRVTDKLFSEAQLSHSKKLRMLQKRKLSPEYFETQT